MPKTAVWRHFPSCRHPLARGLSLRLLLAAGMSLAGVAQALSTPASAPLTCPVPQADAGGAPPCGAASALGPIGEPDLDTGIGNPVHLATGEKFLREIDLPEPAHGQWPAFVRLYRSGSRTDGPLGQGWTTEYDVRLRRQGGGWQLLLPDGRILSYDARGHSRRVSDGRLVATRWPETGQPAETLPAHAAGAPMAWLGRGGHRLDFDGQGRLRVAHRPGRAIIGIEYHETGPFDGLMRRIRRGASALTLRYALMGGRPILQSLDSPAGTFLYRYDTPAPHEDARLTQRPDDAQSLPETPLPARLTEVRRPDGMRRIHHYETDRQAGHPGAVTGITLQDAAGRHWRARTWTYGAQGRVVEAIPGPPTQTAGRLALRYPDDGGIATGSGVLRDDQNRLTKIDGLRITRHPDGVIRQLLQTPGGWPGLQLDYDHGGRLTAWSSALTGQTRVSTTPGGQPQGLLHASGDRLDLRSDTVGRPARLRYTSPGQTDISVSIQWRGRQPERLEHPSETEYLNHDDAGRLRSRTIHRPHPAGMLQYQEAFDYDAMGHLSRHALPEDGALHYAWSGAGRLSRIVWEDADGTRHTVIDTVPGAAGYRYGNGLHLQTGTDARGRADRLALSDGQRILWGEWRRHDDRGQVMQLTQLAPDEPRLLRRFAYDMQGRLAGIAQRAQSRSDGRSAWRTSWFAWADDGSLAGLRTLPGPIGQTEASDPAAGTRKARAGIEEPGPGSAHPIPRDAAGLPLSIDGLALRYQAQRRLAEVRKGDHILARYTYNARGQQIRQRQGTQEIERYYVDNRLAARWLRPAPAASDPPAIPRFGVSQRYIYAQEAPVGLLQTDDDGRTRLYFIHADLLGAPVLVTDGQRTVRWSATYDVLGRSTRRSGDLTLPLRWPGQDEDPATGWHDNVFRTYLPRRGQYLEPDPLGPVPGQQALGYGAQQPMRHVDPLGLILLAFDGTRYGRANQSNVWKLTQAYTDGPAYYHAGPGNNLYLDWDAVTAASSGQILRNQWQSLLNALQRAQGSPQAAPIDILGYSRGAALAREFANRIARQTRNGWFSYDDPLRGTIALCVDLRFLGLFDTVAQFGLLGAANAGFDLSVSGAWGWVAHAVALHELRSLFPLISATGGQPGNTVEAPFIGAHADIGGGLLLNEEGQPTPDGDLSDVALNWMRWQALAALVPMKPLADADRLVARPWLHDERIPAQRLLAGDRELQDAGTRPLGPQGADARLGNAQRALFESFIQRMAGWELRSGSVVGTVDMQGYGAWLESQLGLSGMAGPPRQP